MTPGNFFVMFLSILSQMRSLFNANQAHFEKKFQEVGILEIFTCIEKNIHDPERKNFTKYGTSTAFKGLMESCSVNGSSAIRHSSCVKKAEIRTAADESVGRRSSVFGSHQRDRVNSSRYKVEDPVPIPSIWKLATNAPRAHPRLKSELTVLLIADSTPSNQTEW